MRAAVLGCSEPGRVSHDDSDPLPRSSAARECDVRVTAVLLPPGVSAAALGRRRIAALDAPFKVDARMPGWAMVVLANAGRERPFDGHDIPGPVDVPMLAPGALDVAGTVAELEPWRDTALRIWKREEGWLRTPRMVLGAPRSAFHVARAMRGGLKEVVSEIGDIGTGHPGPEAGERPDDASHPPVQGVGYATWVAVLGGLRHDEVHPSHVEAYATHRGVPPGRWAAVDAAWEVRAGEDPRLRTWSDWDRRRAG
jgi:hypothetical protein